MTPAPDPTAESLKVLDLPPNPSADQIRRAYKKACLRHHPDKHPPGPARTEAERIFKNIAVAYSQLLESSTVTSSTSSTTPPTPPSRPTPFSTSSNAFADDIASDDAFSANAFVAPDRELDMQLTLEEFAEGCVKRRKLRVPGMAEASHPVLSVSIKPGYRPGDRIRFRGAWTTPGPQNPADVVFILSAKPHKTFELSGDDLSLRMRLNLVDALAGAMLVVPGLDGRPLNLLLDPVISPTHKERLVGRGMPCRSDPSVRGDLYVSFDIVFPTRVDPVHRPALRDLFSRLDSAPNPKRYVRRSSSLFVNLHPPYTNSRRASAAIDPEGNGSVSHATPLAKPSMPVRATTVPSKQRRRFASIFR